MNARGIIFIFAILFSCDVLDGLPAAAPAFSYPTELYPSGDIQAKIKAIFTETFIQKLLDVGDMPDVKKDLEAAGFKILQYLPNDPKSVVVVEHPSLPGYVLKFSRTHYIIINEPAPSGLGNRRWSDLKLRVENARKLRFIVESENIKTVQIPQKYLMYIKQFPIVIAEKANIPEQPTPLNMLNREQVADLLFLVKRAKGVLDLKPDNIIFDGKYIYLIDTEKIEMMTPTKLKTKLTKSVEKFKRVINPEYVSCVDEWFANLDKADTSESACLRSHL